MKEKDTRDSIDFGKEKISHLFNSIFIPTLLGMVFNVTFVLADGIFVGHGVGAEGLASVNLVSPIMMILTGLGMMFGMGSSVVAAIHLSQNNTKAARINVTQAYIASFVIAVIFAIFCYSCPYFVIHLLGTSAELTELVKEYLVWFIPTCVLLMIQIVGEFVIRLDGSPKYAMMANIVPAVLNIVLDYIFIFPFGWGLMGAALATTIGTGVGAALTLYYMLKKTDTLSFYPLKWTRKSLCLMRRNVGYMMRVGFSGFLGEFAASVMAYTGNIAFGKLLGDTGIAAFSVICYLIPVAFNVYYAVSSSAQPIISYNYGANQDERAKQTFRFGLKISLIFALVVTLCSQLFSSSIIAIFLERGSGAFEIAEVGLPIFAISFIFMGYNVSAIGYFQSTEQNLIATLLVSLRGIVLLIVGFILLPLWLGTTGLWLVVPVAEVITTIVAACLYAKKSKN